MDRMQSLPSLEENGIPVLYGDAGTAAGDKGPLTPSFSLKQTLQQLVHAYVDQYMDLIANLDAGAAPGVSRFLLTDGSTMAEGTDADVLLLTPC
jgi:hypothetical protein